MYKSNIKNSYESVDHINIETMCGKQYKIEKWIFSKLLTGTNLKIKDESIAKKLIEMKIITEEKYKIKEAKITKIIIFFLEKTLEASSKITQKLNHKITACASITIVFFHLFFEGKALNIKSSMQAISPIEAVFILSIMTLSAIIHEFGHAISYYNYTRDKGRVKIKINFLLPSLYYKFGILFSTCTDHQKIIVYLSSVYLQLLTLSVFIVSLKALKQENNYFDLVISIIAMKALFNLLPIADTDGMKAARITKWINTDSNLFKITKKMLEIFIGSMIILSLLYLITIITKHII